jgi:hypothetical protein
VPHYLIVVRAGRKGPIFANGFKVTSTDLDRVVIAERSHFFDRERKIFEDSEEAR